MIKAAVVALGMAVATSVVAHAQTITANIEGWSQYHGSDGNIFDEDASLQTSVSGSTNDGWYVGAWFARDGEGKQDFGYEDDLFAGKSGQLGGVAYTAEFQYFSLTNFGDVWNTSLKLSPATAIEIMDGVTMTPYVKFDHYFPAGSAPASGTLIRVGPALSADLGGSWTLGFDPQVFHDNGAFGNDEGFILFANASLGYAFGNGLSVAGLIRHSTPLGDDQFRSEQTSFALQVTKTWN